MKSKYILSIRAIGQFPRLEIGQELFEQIKASRQILSHALAIEEKYEIIVANYLDFEREVASELITEMVRRNHEYIDFFNLRLALNTRLINLLTSIRLYNDQVASHVSSCIPHDDNAKAKVKKLQSDEYNISFHYRFMEALRNYVQHRGLPVHRTSKGGKWTTPEDGFLEWSLFFCTQKEELVSNGNFKKLVLDEMPDEVNLIVATRSYIESISKIHIQVREAIEKRVQLSRSILDKAIQDYSAAYGKEAVVLFAYEYKDDEITDEVSILTFYDDIRRKLVKKNRKLVNLKRMYISSQAYDK